MLEKSFVPFELAVKLKELGFDEPCFRFKNNISNIVEEKGWLNWNEVEKFVSLPLYQQAFKFFREKYGLWFRPDYYDEDREYDYTGNIHKLGKYSSVKDLNNYNSVEELELDCLKKMVEIVENNK